jgi:PAS domain S-box-containing protein
MSIPEQVMNLPALEQVIDRSPITVSPETRLVDAISLMSQAPGRHCALPDADLSIDANLQGPIQSSCVLVMDGLRLVGVLTERDVVKLAAAEMSLNELTVADAMTRQVVTISLSASATTLSALAMFHQYRIRHLPVLDAQGQLVGIITPNNIRQVLQPMNLLRLRRVEEAMNPEVIHASRTASVLEIARQMAEHRVSCVVITESVHVLPEAPHEDLPLNPVGIITERDVVQFQALELNFAQISAQTVMSTPLCCLNPTDSLWTAHEQMQARYVRRLVVAGDRGELLGVITQTSVLQFLNPLEMAGIIETLQKEVDHRTDELTQVNRQLEQEISGHRKTEALLQESQRKLEGILNHAFEFMGLLAPDGTVLEANQTSLDYAGVCKADVIGRPFWETPWWTRSPDSQAPLRTAIAQAAGGEFVRYEVTLLSPTGQFDTFDFSITPVKDETGKVIFLIPEAREINDRKQMELQLQAAHAQLEGQVDHQIVELTLANARLRQESSDRKQAELEIQKFVSLADNSTELIGMCGMDFVPTYINPAGKRMVGLDDTRQYIETPVQEFFFPEDRDFVINDFFPRVLREGQGEVEIRFRHFKTGEAVWMVYSVFCIRDRHEQPIGLATISRNISEAKRDEVVRKQAEEKIREQAALIDISPDAIMVRDLDCHILFWNKGAEQIYGWTSAEILDKNSCELLCKQPPLQLEDALQSNLLKGEWRGELQKLTKSGKEIRVSSRWKLLRDATGQPHAILTVDTDITEQKQLEAQFLRAQRLESLGILASGIAHDMNNILAPMLASAQLLPVLSPTLDEQSRQLLAIFEDSARRGTELVKQILAFARGLEGERMAVQVKHILAELERTIVSTFPKSIEIVHNFPKQDLWLVSANATQLHQVFMNFCVNARDAMPNGGTLSISAKNRVIDETYVRMNLDAAVGDYVLITFEDKGTGISPEHIDRIFDPFFTTKRIGEGTGLGLSTVMGIIKNHGGFLTVSSKVGKGTRFQVFLPAGEATKTLPEETQATIQGQGELVLVVDDEANIRETLKLTLEAQNYQVLLATNGIEAIAAYATHQDRIKVVLIDMMMPSMDGSTAIRTLQQFNPQIKVIACSGASTNDSLLKTVEVEAFLPKPFTADTLLSTLHKVLRDD